MVRYDWFHGVRQVRNWIGNNTNTITESWPSFTASGVPPIVSNRKPFSRLFGNILSLNYLNRPGLQNICAVTGKGIDSSMGSHLKQGVPTMIEPAFPELFLPNWPYEDLRLFITNQSKIEGSTEDFSNDEKFCTRVDPNTEDMAALYGHDQVTYNNQSSAICLALLHILIRSNGDREHLKGCKNTYLEAFRNAQEKYKKGLCIGEVATYLEDYITDTSVEWFFVHIAYFRFILAAASPEKSDRWKDFGKNRYTFFDKSLFDENFDPDSDEHVGPELITSLYNARYRASVVRGAAVYKPQFWYELELNAEIADLETRITRGELSRDQCDQEIASFKELNPEASTHYNVIRLLEGKYIKFARFFYNSSADGGMLTNYCVKENIYEELHNYMNGLFLTLFALELPSARTVLTTIFRIQFWFIHIMPWHRGSAAGMNMIRYVLIAYYNYRAHALGRPMLPTVPSRRGYFPDLEAFLTCETEDDFVKGSFEDYYCVNYNVYCEE